ncbi:TPA: hypothetical protein QDA98_004604 [Burkholderia vietnamiensis]|nr:hypothetical protein [Burkholderia vietnamiensis]
MTYVIDTPTNGSRQPKNPEQAALEWFEDRDEVSDDMPSSVILATEGSSTRGKNASNIYMVERRAHFLKLKRAYRFRRTITAPASDAPRQADIETEFNSLVQTWKNETKLSSLAGDMVFHPAYQRIIGMGPRVLPLVLRELEKSGGHWFHALEMLTGESPIASEDRGKMRKMAQTWLDWGRSKGVI